jgi:hypothetical protein
MNLQALLIRVHVLIATCLILIGAIAYKQPQASAAQAPRARAQPAIAAVVGERAVTLPTIHVRPVARAAKAAIESPAPRLENASIRIAVQTTRSDGSSSSPANPSLDMPYYSFGKALPRIGKE